MNAATIFASQGQDSMQSQYFHTIIKFVGSFHRDKRKVTTNQCSCQCHFPYSHDSGSGEQLIDQLSHTIANHNYISPAAVLGVQLDVIHCR